MRKWLLGVLFALLFTGTAGAVSARSAIVLDAQTGAVLFEQNADEILPMASTTKIMTALVALEQGDLDRTYTVKKEYTLVEGSSMYLKEGEEITLRDTLYGLMLMSGNDAALAIAGECGGLESFVAAMNDKALELGLGNTHFDNPNGLDSANHHTTARELAQLTAYAMQNPTFCEIVGTATYSSNGRTMVNHNKLLRLYPDAIGVKTGYTKKSGRCLVSATERNGRRLIAVTLNDPDDWDDHIVMLDVAFAQFEECTLHEAGQSLGEVPCAGGDVTTLPLSASSTVTAWLTPEEQEALETVVYGRPFVYAPATAGATYGTIEYRLGDHVVAQDTLVFAEDSAMLPERKNRLEKIIDQIRSFFGLG
ncbi:D-alanyl-D-alanine carboxypeptidase family protein [Intestinibacillus sp. Marseille-P6563]|uniref:D-alanyl-D-alanine carboxypeptidase family protein n=1 Tax=Intestinibacillus sp. Marseille-P6563 TaxID=2364792 RepID=UPI000F06122F|nr:D-alanyl-D-alanine carboxypeptidase family protein [Intestinibacillus sp. Marseille-P6563]